jgi:hypothetical protein
MNKKQRKELQELADNLECGDFSIGRQLSPEEMAITSALFERSIWDKELRRAISVARKSGVTWQVIGDLLGVTPQAAHKKYAHLVNDLS